ncbi:hypothetical protein JVT61DRAFT_9094 [Boletus reticuloceps]|uniref:Uncharacterized protein n=1 Tax=Boletus reticuloceps TaxID=495285 RepID=A0A8I2YGW0_9AGAM|nr:hypothetical protein JVT61DRAFT_9094 [Boletus reticuloceps]
MDFRHSLQPQTMPVPSTQWDPSPRSSTALNMRPPDSVASQLSGISCSRIQIRHLPGFERFLLPKEFSQLRASSHSGPVVILNAATHRCDVLIVLSSVDHVIHVPLPNFSFHQSIDLQGILKSFLRHAHVERTGQIERWDRSTWGSFLSPLWKCVVEPVIYALAFR